MKKIVYILFTQLILISSCLLIGQNPGVPHGQIQEKTKKFLRELEDENRQLGTLSDQEKDIVFRYFEIQQQLVFAQQSQNKSELISALSNLRNLQQNPHFDEAAWTIRTLSRKIDAATQSGLAINFVFEKTIAFFKNTKNLLPNEHKFNAEAKSWYDQHLALLTSEQRKIIADYFRLKAIEFTYQDKIDLYGNEKYFQSNVPEWKENLLKTKNELVLLINSPIYKRAEQKLNLICSLGQVLVVNTADLGFPSDRLYRKLEKLILLLDKSAVKIYCTLK